MVSRDRNRDRLLPQLKFLILAEIAIRKTLYRNQILAEILAVTLDFKRRGFCIFRHTL